MHGEMAGYTATPETVDDVKQRYEAQNAHRFRIPQNEAAQGYLGGLRTGLDEYRQSHPEVAGFTLYGSLTKGHATERSDIDGYMFVDVGRVPVAESDAETSAVEMVHDEVIGDVSYAFAERLGQKYTSEVRDAVGKAAGLPEEQLHHLTAVPVSPDIIKLEIERLLPWAEQTLEYQRNMQQLEADPKGWMQPQPSSPEVGSPSALLSNLFHLQVGHGLEAYRQQVLDHLTVSGAAGEFLWSRVARNIEMGEQEGFRANTSKPYPRTLDDARRIYGASS